MGPLGLGAAVYGVLLIAGERLLNDPDTYWHIATGRWIWAHATVPTTDPFSYTLHGAPWIAHEWLAELILAAVYEALGWAGLVLLSALAVAASLALLFGALECRVRSAAALGAAAMAFFLMAAHVTARPHVLALPILVAWSAAVVSARDRERPPSLLLLPLMALWANLHGGFVVGFGLAGALGLEAVLAAGSGPGRRAAISGWGRFLAGAALASLLTPQGFAGWWFPFRLMSLDFALSLVGEWRSAPFSLFEPLVLWLAVLIAFSLAVGLRAPLTRVLMVTGLVAIALRHTRNAELLAMLAPILLAEPVGRLLPPSPPRGRPRARHIAAFVLFIASATAAASLRGYAHDNPGIAPTAALAAARHAGLTGPIFNDYDFGGFLIFEGVPPFVDGRIDLYGDDFMRLYAAALSADGGALARVLDHYGVTWSLLKPDEPAVAALDRDPRWERIYADASAVVHRRR